MLNFLEEGRLKNLPQRSIYSVETVVDRLQPPRERAIDRLVVRRWVVVLGLVIIAMLTAIHSVPLVSALIAGTVFVAGTALLPRVRTVNLPRPLVMTSRSGPRPETIIRAVINGLQDPVIVLNAEGTILFHNARARELFDGLKIGWHISGAIRHPRLLNGVAIASAQQAVQVIAYSERVPVERHIAVTISWLDTASEPADPAIVLFVRDLTEQERLDQTRADFIANASHELKTPLASLRGFIETLQGAARNDEQARDRFLAIMAKQAERMTRLIDNLMSLNRVEMRAHLKPQDHINITEVVESAADALDPLAAESRIHIGVTSRASGALVLGDRDELTQVFMNLIHNAIKYGNPDGAVNVAIEREPGEGNAPGRILISVEDDGMGIPTRYLPRLTERFYRVPDMAGPDRGGAGLGLAIAKHVVARHRGELRIRSEESVGSCFTVVLTELQNS